jgi:hypothetical protein
VDQVVDPKIIRLWSHPIRARLTRMARKPTTIVSLRLRLPEALRATLASEAEKAARSLNSEILWRLGQTLSEEWRRFIAGQEDAERRDQETLDRIMSNPKSRAILNKLIADARAKPNA